MLKFKPLELEDREIFLDHMKEYKFKTYEYSFSTLYLWRKLCNVEYALFKESIILRKNEFGKGMYFMQPIAYDVNDLDEIVSELREYKDMQNSNNLFRDVEDAFLSELKELYNDKIVYREDVDNFDYIYDASKLRTLSGKKLHGKKNHYNQFISSYNFEIRDLEEPGVAEDCIEFETVWSKSKDNFNNHLTYEYEGIKDVIKKMNILNLVGMAVYVDNKVVGFTIGEKVNSDMGIIHIEKGDPEYKGIYAFINKTFIENYLCDTTIINREEDLGIEGLRKAKESYHPIRLEKKYIVDFVSK